MKFLNPHILEGDFIETYDGLIFDGKDIRHPEENTRKIGYLRYIPVRFFDPDYELLDIFKKKWLKAQIEKDFDIQIDDIRYGKTPYVKIYDMRSRFDVLERFKPTYIFNSEMFDFPLQTVPSEDIKTIHSPDQFLKSTLDSPNVDPLLIRLVEFITIGADIPKSCMGLSGSKMIGLEGDISDFDLIIYGEKESRKVHDFLEEFLFYPEEFPREFKNIAKITPYTEEFLQEHYKFRAKGFNITYEQFRQTESRKTHQFLFDGHHVFIRYVKKNRYQARSRQMSEFKYKTLGRVEVIGKIVEDSDSIFTPGTYSLYITEFISNKDLINARQIEIYTMRGRFLENASLGNMVLVKGKLEKVIRPRKPKLQIVLGLDPEDLLVQINRSSEKLS